jgi:hypothetical protein
LYLLEILVAFLQAYIFTMLSAVYFGMANEEHQRRSSSLIRNKLKEQDRSEQVESYHFELETRIQNSKHKSRN